MVNPWTREERVSTLSNTTDVEKKGEKSNKTAQDSSLSKVTRRLAEKEGQKLWNGFMSHLFGFSSTNISRGAK